MLGVESRVLYGLESSFPTTPKSVHLLIFCLLSVLCLLLLLVCLFCLETGPHLAKAGSELLILMPPPPKSWDYRHLPPWSCLVPPSNFKVWNGHWETGSWEMVAWTAPPAGDLSTITPQGKASCPKDHTASWYSIPRPPLSSIPPWQCLV